MDKEQPKRTPQQIIGDDALTQLIFEGYEVVPARRSSAEQAEVVVDGVAWAKVRVDTEPENGWCFATPPNHSDDVKRGLLPEWNEREQFFACVIASPPSVAKGGVTEVLLRLVHQPNPTDPTRWDVAPGKHKEFSALCASLAVGDEGIREGWQPIETATKDHKAPDIILFARFPDQGTGFVEDIRIGRWVSGAGPNASLEGWESDEGIHADGYFSFWMPLPTPPSRGEGK